MEQQPPLLTAELKPEHNSQQAFASQLTTFPSFDEMIPVRTYRQAQLAAELPIVLVLHDNQGPTVEIEKFCQYLADVGYLAIAPDLFSRQYNASETKGLSEEQLSNIKDSQVMFDLDRCAHWALKQGGQARSLSIIGFGWGGRMSCWYCAHTPQLKAAISCDPILSNTLSLARPTRTLDQLARLQAPLLLINANQQPDLSPDDKNMLQQQIDAKGSLAITQMNTADIALLKAIQPEINGEVPMLILPKIMAFLTEHNPIPHQ